MTDASEAVVRGYYEAIDAKNYERLADLLAPNIVHERPDRTIEGRETLVGFMRDDRPNKDTSHEVEAVYRRTETSDEAENGTANDADDGTPDDAEAGNEPNTTPATADYAVRGHLLDASGNPMFAFVDVFEIEDGRIARIRTYTR